MPDPKGPAASDPRRVVAERLAEFVDGTVPESLQASVATSDPARDLVHDARRAAELAKVAGADVQPLGDWDRRIERALDARGSRSAVGAPSPTLAAPPATASSRATAFSHLWSLFVTCMRARPWATLTVALFAGAAASFLLGGIRNGRLDPSVDESGSIWHGTIVHVARTGSEGVLRLCDAPERPCREVGRGEVVPAGAALETDQSARAQLRMDDGSEISLDRRSRLVLSASPRRTLTLAYGGIVATVRHRGDRPLTLQVPAGHLLTRGAKFSVRAAAESVTVDVSRGRVTLIDRRQREVSLVAGDEGRLTKSRAPFVAASQALADSMAWSDGARGELGVSALGRGLGELRARKPGEDDEREGAVTLAAHRVKVRIVGAVARTEVEEIFTNSTDEVLEGIFRFPLPSDASVEGLALEADGRLVRGAFVDRERAAAIWRGSIAHAAPTVRHDRSDEIIWAPGPWRDPALLEWQRGSRFELRIYPIPRHGSRRVVLTYTQVVSPSADVRRYTYPLAHDRGHSTSVGEFSLDLEVRGHDPASGLRSVGYPTVTSAPSPEVGRLGLSERDFLPRGDIVVEYSLAKGAGELHAWGYVPEPAAVDTRWRPSAASAEAEANARPYFAAMLRPVLPRPQGLAARDYTFVVDTSRSMVGESMARAAEVAARIVTELSSEDTVAALACDDDCRRFTRGRRAANHELAAELRSWLLSQQTEGASDLAAAVRAGIASLPVGGSRGQRVVYIGDGTPTMGPVRPGTLEAAVRASRPPPRTTVTAVAIGGDSDLQSLRAVTRAGGGTVLPYTPGGTVAEVAFATLAATLGQTLTDVEVELPPGLVAAAGVEPDPIAAGGEIVVAARMSQPSVRGEILLRGRLGEEHFERRYPVDVRAVPGQSNAFVPRLYAAQRIATLEQQADEGARTEALRLSRSFGVASRYTSLLVLESPAMFRAFGLNNGRPLTDWSAEQAATHVAGESQAPTGAEAWRLEDMDSDPRAGVPRPRSVAGSGGHRAPASRAARAKRWAPPPPDSATRDASRKATRGDRRGRRWLPMRRRWTRQAEFVVDRQVPSRASPLEVSKAEGAYAREPNSRSALQALYNAYAASGELQRAAELAERWSEKDALDAGALTARADLAARRGERALAIRLLGSVVDMRPGDAGAQRRLARLHRWQGRPAIGCRFSVALAELRTADGEALAEALRCTRATGRGEFAELLLRSAEAKTRGQAETLLATSQGPEGLSGDFRLQAHWQGSVDVDLSLLHPDGHRVSWLGAPTHSVITATDVLATDREGLALRGARPGEYVIELTRGAGQGTARGSVTVSVGTSRRDIPFVLTQSRVTLGIARVWMQEHLVRAR